MSVSQLPAPPLDAPQVSSLVVKSGPYPVTLGSILFSTEELPDKWDIGASQQMLVVDDLPGGGRVVNDMGNSANEITWTGRFYGSNIWPRVQQLRLYQVNSVVIPLNWWNEKYLVVIKSFNPGYMGGRTEYEITLVVIQDQNGAFTVSTAQSIDQVVQSLQSQAITQQNAVQAAEQAAQNPPPLPAQDVYGQYLLDLWEILGNAAPLSSNIVQYGPAILTAAQIAIAGVQQYQGSILPTDPQFPNTVGLLASLLTLYQNVQAGMVQKTVPFDGGDLFEMAALEYGDITQCFAIASANSLVYPTLPSGSSNVAIPPPQQGT